MILRISIRRILCIVMCSFLALPTLAQVKSWGDVSRNELKKKNYASDQNAVAVILFEKGNLRIGDDLNYFLDKHVRIKILREEGYDWGTVNIDYNTDYEQKVEDIEAITYTLNADGNKIEEHQLAQNSIFDEEIINDWNQKKFTFPALQPGCIIEYRYTLKVGDPAYIPLWYFDATIPVVQSELTAEFPSFLKFTKVFSGDKELDVNKSEGFNESIRYTFENDNDDLYSAATGNKDRGHLRFNGERFTWAMNNRKAIKDLPYMTSPKNYMAKIDFQLSELSIPTKNIQKDFTKSWDNVIDGLIEDEYDSYLNGRVNLIDAKSIIEENASLSDKVRSIFKYVSTTFNWNAIYGTIPSDDINNVLETKAGTGVELNLILTRLLNDAGIEAYPVLMSTRNYGSVSKDFVLTDQFNHVIVYVRSPNQDYLLDSTAGNRPLTILPERDLNGTGLMVSQPYSEDKHWIRLMPLQKTIKVGTVQAEIKKDGSIAGKTSYQSTGYQAFDERTMVQEKGKDYFINSQLFKNFERVNVLKFNHNELTALDDPFTYTAFFDSARSSATQVTNEFIYLDSTPFMKWNDNPLKLPNREYPVNFPYSNTEKFVILLQIPEGYALESYPEALTVQLPKQGGSFIRQTKVQNGQIMIQSTIKLAKSIYSTDEYDRLRSLFNKIIESHSEKIVLKKNE